MTRPAGEQGAGGFESLVYVGNKDVVLVFRLVDSQGSALSTGPEETLSPGQGGVRGVFGSNVTVACEIDLISGGKGALRAAATVTGKFPDRRTTAAVEVR